MRSRLRCGKGCKTKQPCTNMEPRLHGGNFWNGLELAKNYLMRQPDPEYAQTERFPWAALKAGSRAIEPHFGMTNFPVTRSRALLDGQPRAAVRKWVSRNNCRGREASRTLSTIFPNSTSWR